MQISSAQADLSRTLAQLSNADASRIPMALQLANLVALHQRIGVANASDLQRLQVETTAIIATAQSIADAATGNNANPAKALEVATAEARQAVHSFMDDYYEKRKFDKFLEFSSDEDERAYREREKKRQEEIQKAFNDGTPQSNALALRLAKEQLEDAGIHGADRSPNFQDQSEKLDKAYRNLDYAIIAASTPSPSSQTDQSIATLRKAGVTVADQSGEGHGVTIDASVAQFLARG